MAAGGAGKGDQRMIRRWPQSGGNPVDMPVAENTITSLATLPYGAWLYATAEPSWGIITPEGRSLARHDSPITDFRGIFRHHFALSADGLVVEWRLTSQQVARFDLSRQELTINPPRDSGLTPPITHAVLLSLINISLCIRDRPEAVNIDSKFSSTQNKAETTVRTAKNYQNEVAVADDGYEKTSLLEHRPSLAYIIKARGEKAAS